MISSGEERRNRAIDTAASLSNYRGTLSWCSASRTRNDSHSISGHRYRAGAALLRRVRSRGRANHGKAVPAPETGSEGISRGDVYVAGVFVCGSYVSVYVCARARACVRSSVRTCVRAYALVKQGHGGAKGEAGGGY